MKPKQIQTTINLKGMWDKSERHQAMLAKEMYVNEIKRQMADLENDFVKNNCFLENNFVDYNINKKSLNYQFYLYQVGNLKNKITPEALSGWERKRNINNILKDLD